MTTIQCKYKDHWDPGLFTSYTLTTLYRIPRLSEACHVEGLIPL